MNKTPPWIASFVQQCLSFYLGEGNPNPIDVDDDGTNLSFRVNGLSAKANVANVCLSFARLREDLLTNWHLLVGPGILV